MAKKNRVKIQHYHTLYSEKAPQDLIYGEIAVSHTEGHEGIYLRSYDEGEYKIRKIIDSAQTQNLIDKHFRPSSGSTPGYVKTFGGDVDGAPAQGSNFPGYATTPSHTHSRYLETTLFNDFSGATQNVVNKIDKFFSGATNTNYDNLKSIQDRIENLDSALDKNGIKRLLENKVARITSPSRNNIEVKDMPTGGILWDEDITFHHYIISHTEPQAINKIYCANPYESEILSNMYPGEGTVVIPGVPDTNFPSFGDGDTKPVNSDNKITVYNGESFNIINTLAVDFSGHIVSDGISAATVTIEELKQATDTQFGGVYLSNENDDIDAESQEVGANMAANFHHRHSNYLSKKELSDPGKVEHDIIINCGTWEDDEWYA